MELEFVAPLLQTAIWAGLIAVVLWKFYTPLYELLVALRKRVESGSDVKLGPVEISGALRPQSIEEQAEKSEKELREVSAPQLVGQETSAGPARLPTDGSLRERFYQAEDLVMRHLQAEYGVPIQRQVTAGADPGYDGVFIRKGRVHIVEVKYVPKLGKVMDMTDSLGRIASSARSYGWGDVQIILAVVFEDASEGMRQEKDLKSISERVGYAVSVRIYSVGELSFWAATRASGG